MMNDDHEHDDDVHIHIYICISYLSEYVDALMMIYNILIDKYVYTMQSKLARTSYKD